MEHVHYFAGIMALPLAQVLFLAPAFSWLNVGPQCLLHGWWKAADFKWGRPQMIIEDDLEQHSA